MNNNFDISNLERKPILDESEQELFDALIDEYNDIFENILNMHQKNLFDKIMDNVKAILGEKKMENYSKVKIAKALLQLKIRYYTPDFLDLKPITELISSASPRDLLNKIPILKIRDIFSHCEKCDQCYHICGDILLRPHNSKYIICLKCKMIYKEELIHLFCKKCD